MKKITFSSNYGNFATRLTAEIGEDVNAATTWLAETQGLGNIAYRVAGSKVDKAFGVKTAKDRKFEKRVDVPFSAANQLIVETAVRSAIEELEKATPSIVSLNLTFNVTGLHEFGSTDTAPTKEATELWVKIQQLPTEKFNEKLKVLGLNEHSYDDATAVLAIRDALRKARAAAAEQQKAMLQ